MSHQFGVRNARSSSGPPTSEAQKSGLGLAVIVLALTTGQLADEKQGKDPSSGPGSTQRDERLALLSGIQSDDDPPTSQACDVKHSSSN